MADYKGMQRVKALLAEREYLSYEIRRHFLQKSMHDFVAVPPAGGSPVLVRLFVPERRRSYVELRPLWKGTSLVFIRKIARFARVPGQWVRVEEKSPLMWGRRKSVDALLPPAALERYRKDFPPPPPKKKDPPPLSVPASHAAAFWRKEFSYSTRRSHLG